MAKYKCTNCPHGSCFIEEQYSMIPLERCPFLGIEVTPKWEKEDQPKQAEGSSTPLTAEGEIVKAARKQTGETCSAGADISFLLTDFAVLLDSENQARKAEIEAVRKEVRCHEAHIAEHFPALLERFNEQTDRIQPLERKVEELKGEIQAVSWETELLRRDADYRKHKQKSQPRAQAPDKDGNMHDLIPGVSLIRIPNINVVRIFHHKDGEDIWGFWSNVQLSPDEPCRPLEKPSATSSDGIQWVCDLSFPDQGGAA